MLKGNRGILAAFAGLAALFCAAGFGAFYGSLYAPDRKDYQAAGRETNGSQDYNGPTESLSDIAGLPGPVERAIANPQPSNGDDSEKRDLAAQEASALWAFWMVTLSALSVVVTTIGTVLLYKQIILTRRAVEDTSEATDAMREANQISREMADFETRPWLVIDEIALPDTRVYDHATDPLIALHGHVRVKNIGRGIARNTYFRMGLAHSAYDAFVDAKGPFREFGHHAFIQPGKEHAQLILHTLGYGAWPPERREAALYIAIGVFYQSPGNKAVHGTISTWALSSTEPPVICHTVSVRQLLTDAPGPGDIKLYPEPQSSEMS